MMADVYEWAYACTWNWIGFHESVKLTANHASLTRIQRLSCLNLTPCEDGSFLRKDTMRALRRHSS